MTPKHRRFLEELLSETRRANLPGSADFIQQIERALARGTITVDSCAHGDDDARPGTTL